MSVTARVFLLAPSLARLIEKEREGRHVRQGYFPDRPDRGTHVQLEQETGRLILVFNHPNGPIEEATDIPRSQAEALLELAAGQVEYLEVSLDIGSQAATLRRFLTPGSLDLLTIPFEHGKRARKVQPLAWFGPEVTGDPAYQGRTMALNGLPSVPEVEITDAALNSLLDVLEGRFGVHQSQATAPQPVAPSKPAEAEAEAEHEDDQDDLEIEDSVIRELARSLSPRQR
jgi:CYTH domain-containing protein